MSSNLTLNIVIYLHDFFIRLNKVVEERIESVTHTEVGGTVSVVAYRSTILLRGCNWYRQAMAILNHIPTRKVVKTKLNIIANTQLAVA